MSKAEERAIEKYPADKSVFDKYEKQRYAYICGYIQAEKDLLANKHEKSWRLDEKLWKGIKDVEEASYQYTYDASNDWAYDVPTWDDVQDAFKAGSEWKENHELTWEDMMTIDDLLDELLPPRRNSDELVLKGYYEEVLKRFKERKEL